MSEHPSHLGMINTASSEEIEAATGISSTVAERLVESRPYRRREDLLVDELAEYASLDDLTALLVPRFETPPPNLPLPSSETVSVTHDSGITYGVVTEIDRQQRVFLRTPTGNELISARMRSDTDHGDVGLDHTSIRILSWPPTELFSFDHETRSRMWAILHSDAASAAANLREEELSNALDPDMTALVNELSQIFSGFQAFTQSVSHDHAPAAAVQSGSGVVGPPEGESCGDVDHCTGVPDFNAAIAQCCDAHDVCYCRGGTEEDRLECDKELYRCIKEDAGNPQLAWIYYIGVRVFGAPHFNYLETYVVTCTNKDEEGVITELGVHDATSPIGELGWFAIMTAEEVIKSIEDGDTYHVRTVGGPEIIVVDDPDGKYLRTEPDAHSYNNLDNLPDCGGVPPGAR